MNRNESEQRVLELQQDWEKGIQREFESESCLQYVTRRLAEEAIAATRNGLRFHVLPSEKETREKTDRFLNRQRCMKDDLRRVFQEDHAAVKAELRAEMDGRATDDLIDMLFEMATYDRITQLHEGYCEGQTQSEMDKEEGTWLDKQR